MDLNALKSIMLSIAQARSVEPVLGQIVHGIAEASDAALVRVWLLQRDADCPVCQAGGKHDNSRALHLAASAGVSRVNSRDYSGTTGHSHRVGMGERKIGVIAATGEPMLVPDVSPEMEWVADRGWIIDQGIKSFAGQPLICRGEVLGVLALFARSRFSEEDFVWLRMFADHAAVAIWNARAFDELNRLRTQLQLENEYLEDEIKDAFSSGNVVGQSKALRKVMQQVDLVAGTEATVLILGESGTGKELIARAIHDRGSRRTRPLIKVNCGAIPESLFESEFFGHVKGSFTGAIKDRVGRFELANGGDLFLDEIGEIPLSLQAKMLRVLQEKQFERVGDTITRTVDARIIAATNRDFKKEVRAGRFRENIYYRLSVFPIECPPLRERKEDIGPLAAHFLKTKSSRMNLKTPRLSRDQLAELSAYHWPGNVRELENVIERALILSKPTGRLGFDLTTAPSRQHVDEMPEKAEVGILKPEDLRQRKIENILAALNRANGKIFGPEGAANLLGIKPTTLASKIKALGLQKQFVAGK